MDAVTANPASTMSMITVRFAGLPGLPGRRDPRATGRSCRDTTDASCQASSLRPATCDRFWPSAWRLILSLRVDDRPPTLRKAEGNRPEYCKFPEVSLKAFMRILTCNKALPDADRSTTARSDSWNFLAERAVVSAAGHPSRLAVRVVGGTSLFWGRAAIGNPAGVWCQ